MADNSYSDGTISFTQGETTVTFSGAALTTQVISGDVLKVRTVDGLFDVGLVESVTDDLHVEVDAPITRPSVSGAEYVIQFGIGHLAGARPNTVLLRFLDDIEGKGLNGTSEGEPAIDEGRPNEFRIDHASRTAWQKVAGEWILVQLAGQEVNPKGPWVGSPTTKTALSASGSIGVNENNGAKGSSGIGQFSVTFTGNFSQQLPTNVVVGDKYDVLYTSANASATRAFASGHTGVAASTIRTTVGARTRLRFEVTAVSGTTATAVTVSDVTFDTNDKVQDGSYVFVSNVDDNNQPPPYKAGGVPDSDDFWTYVPNTPGAVTSEDISTIVMLTQSEFDAIVSPNPAFLYLIRAG